MGNINPLILIFNYRLETMRYWRMRLYLFNNLLLVKILGIKNL